MKFMKWKSLVITCVICLLTILLGVALWDRLPEEMAIHFNVNNEADNFASKGFVVFGLPVMMAVLQIICCIVNDINAKKHGKRAKFEMATKWIIPVMTWILQIITIGYSLGWKIDIRKSVALLVGAIFIVIGNYMPKFDYVENYNVDSAKARKINRFIGYESVVMGILSIVSAFLPPLFTVVWLFLLIPYAVIGVVYGIKISKG